MAKREWVGNYELSYEWYNDLRDKWIKWSAPLGKCLGHDEAISKAIAYLLGQNCKVQNVCIIDGWGNVIKGM